MSTTHSSAVSPSPNPHRLSRNVLPVRYDLVLSPDLHQRTFVGSVDIIVSVADPTATITLNAIELDLLKAWIVGDDGARNGASITFDEVNERATFTFERTVVSGTAKLHVEFTGILNDKLRGFYASTYEIDGVEKVIGITQMQSTDARRAFPCWDEPDCKAVFGMTLIVDEAHMALSNMHEVSRSVMASGKSMVRFADTPIMSTYLLAFAVGELEARDPIDVGGVPVRIVARPGQLAKTTFSLEVAKFALTYFQDWYGIPYPGSKLDMVATPDFAAGAMENLGLITYRETLLLADLDSATTQDLQNIAAVIAHEIAHMWFGDLVTMSWWNGIWLNEAFATFAEISCIAKFRPEWDKWTTFGIERAAATKVDGLHSTRPIEFPVGPPSEADAMFDVLTYEKGASVIRQLEQFVGEIPFRDGVRSYLAKHSFSNTETNDLFDSLEEVTGEPVRALMDSWIFQGGYPLVGIALDSAAGTATFTQQQFTYLPNPPGDPKTWSVPVMYRTVGMNGAAEHKVLLDATSVTVTVPPGTSYVVANSGGHGFYRVHYDATLNDLVRGQFASLAPIERFHLVSDLWATVLQGSTAAEEFLTFTDSLGNERDLSVWRAVVEGWSELNRVFSEERRADLQARIRNVVGPIVTELDWNETAGEAPLVGQMRGLLIDTIGKLGRDPGIIGGAEERLSSVLDESTTLPPDVGAAVLNLGAITGDVTRFDAYIAAREKTTSPQQNIRILRTLGTFGSDELVQRSLTMMLGPSVRTQDAPYAIALLLTSRTAGPAAWAFVRDNWDRINHELPANSIGRMVETASALSDPAIAREVRAFFEPGGHGHSSAPQAQKKFQQMLEHLEITVALRARESVAVP